MTLRYSCSWCLPSECSISPALSLGSLVYVLWSDGGLMALTPSMKGVLWLQFHRVPLWALLDMAEIQNTEPWFPPCPNKVDRMPNMNSENLSCEEWKTDQRSFPYLIGQSDERSCQLEKGTKNTGEREVGAGRNYISICLVCPLPSLTLTTCHWLPQGNQGLH